MRRERQRVDFGLRRTGRATGFGRRLAAHGLSALHAVEHDDHDYYARNDDDVHRPLIDGNRGVHMRKQRAAFAVLVFIIVFWMSGTAHSQCSFNGPGKAKGIKASLVRAHAQCGNGVTLPAPNTATMAGTPACAAVPHSAFEFGPKGS